MPFRNRVFNKLVVVSSNGQMITIDPGGANPQITFFSQDRTNIAFINAPNQGSSTRVALGMNSGIFTPADAIARRARLFLDDLSGVTQLAVIKSANQARKGGSAQLRYDAGFFGYADDDGGINQNLAFSSSGAFFNSDQVQFLGANVKYDNATPSGTLTFEQGRGIIATMYYTGGTGVTTVAGAEAALPAWTGADSVSFVNNRIYKAHCRGGCFSSVAAATEILRVRLRSAVNSIVAQQLGLHVISVVGGATVSTFDFTVPIKNVSGAQVDKTSLGLTVQRAGASTGNHSLYGDAPTANFTLMVEIEDCGFQVDTNLSSAAVGIT